MNLAQLLLENGINTDNWSHDRGNKTINDLQTEIELGESSLESIDGTLARIVKVVKIVVNVRLGEREFILVEDKQIFFTGAIRQRGIENLSEKIKPDETPTQAACRALKEEIGLDFDGELIFKGEETHQQNSPSYPGLNSYYQMFDYQIVLTAADLDRLRFSEVQQDKISLFTLVEKQNS
ncbi:NUDIX domain-containing protein [Chamaesiphon polymorphus]|uniref:Uncharacterized protein n=1 Tax=Chamaesiphon polymorphus CCALA 037 TaxID=2107692 RepID=A0A2T1GLK9_9CYAN|nr:NUDIX domain-containing protein [Chamaesiphon polymorphus]PSB58762.1 hypothetical protein C7B77_03460 [Chamaesiphon polymorphus CCALA 037]